MKYIKLFYATKTYGNNILVEDVQKQVVEDVENQINKFLSDRHKNFEDVKYNITEGIYGFSTSAALIYRM